MTTITQSPTYRERKTRKLTLEKVFARETRPYVHPYVGGALLGLVLFLAFFITGSGLGASGGLNRLLVYVQDLFVPDHVDRTPYLITMAGGDKNPLASWIVFLTVGVILGGFVSGWRNGRLKVETNKGPNISKRSRWLFAFGGGRVHGVWSADGAWLYFWASAFWRGCSFGWQLGFYVCRVRGRIRAGVFRA